MDAIRRGRSVYVEEVLRAVEEKEKKNVALKEREREGGEEGERKYTRAIIMLPIPQVRAVCLELSRRKANPFSKHILEWLSTGSPDASPRTARTIVISYISEELVWLLSLSLSLSFFSKERETLMFCRYPLQDSHGKKSNISPQYTHCMHGLSRISIRALFATATLKQSSRRGDMSVQKRRSIKYLLWCVHSTLVKAKSCEFTCAVSIVCFFIHSFQTSSYGSFIVPRNFPIRIARDFSFNWEMIKLSESKFFSYFRSRFSIYFNTL